VPTKRALIVDDSKSARVVLSRVLEKLELSVDTTESAESALDYLRENRPDVIFMDHVMSGMDGLQAVQVIKSDPKTASIPIMMYTSQDGELYAGEARALGVAGVLPKLMGAADISLALHRLEILRDPREASSAEFVAPPVPVVGASDSVERIAPAAAGEAAIRVPSALTATECRDIVEPLLREQGADLRRFVVATLESVGTRVISDVTAQFSAAARSAAEIALAAQPPPVATAPAAPAATPAISAPSPRRSAAWLLAGLALLLALAAGGYGWQQRATIAELREQAAAQSRELAATQTALDTVRAANAVPPASAARLAVPYGEVPLAGERLAALGKLVADLSQHGYAGRVRVTTSQGNFCLTGNPSEGYAPAPAEMAANRCDIVGNPFDEALPQAMREPAAIAGFVAATRARQQGPIEIEVTSAARAPSEGAYPTATEVTAAEWNAAAARLNYVEFTLEPRPSNR
jgi:CheY-like chemotaxis protein